MTEQESVQAAQQTAQAISEAARQAAADTTRQVIDASKTARSQEVGAESEFETGMDEFFKHQSQMNALNSKRTYDEYQDLSLASARQNATIVQRMAGLSVDNDSVLRNLSVQALQNALETANMVGKQAVRHSDIAIDREWNVDEVAQAVAKTALFSDAIAAAVVAAVAKVMQEQQKA